LANHLDLFENVINAFFDLFRRGVGWEPQPGGVAECVGHCQVAVNDVVLGHVADHRAVLVKVAVQVVPVEQYLPLDAGKAVEGHHEGGLARATGADQRDKLAGVNRDVDVLQDALLSLPTSHFSD